MLSSVAVCLGSVAYTAMETALYIDGMVRQIVEKFAGNSRDDGKPRNCDINCSKTDKIYSQCNGTYYGTVIVD